MKVKGLGIPIDIGSWAVDQFDSCTLCLNVQSKIVPAKQTDVENILGTESGSLNISKALVGDYCNFELENQLGMKVEQWIVRLSNLQSTLISMKLCNQEFIV